MVTCEGNMFEDYLNPGVIYVITTNGSVRNDGLAVMGRGVAKQAADLHKDVPKILGDLIMSFGNRPYILPYNFVTLPVKYQWMERADVGLIERSLMGLLRVLTTVPVRTIRLPRPGCGDGGLVWGQVASLVEFFGKELEAITKHELEAWSYE